MSRLLVLMLLVPVTVVGQTDRRPSPPAPPTPSQSASASEVPTGYTYDASGRRDPFVSLIRRGVTQTAPVSANRAAGIAGLPVSDVNLRGVMASRGEFVGIVQGADNKTYVIRAGQKLLDGTVRVIEKDAMVIVQQVNDPLATHRQRELRIALKQDEAR